MSLNQHIGSGSFSEVFKVKRVADNKIYALKKVRVTLWVLSFGGVR
jgi:serine/threonine protein kinase